MLGSNRTIMGTTVFRHEQIARAVELGLGTGDPEKIVFRTAGRESSDIASKLKDIMRT